MSAQILTEVSATVDATREIQLVEGFREITAGGIPDGLVRTELLRGQDGQWACPDALARPHSSRGHASPS